MLFYIEGRENEKNMGNFPVYSPIILAYICVIMITELRLCRSMHAVSISVFLTAQYYFNNSKLDICRPVAPLSYIRAAIVRDAVQPQKRVACINVVGTKKLLPP